MDKSTNNWLIFGISILVLGILLLAYSISSFAEIKALKDKIDFETLENNNQMPDSEKYFQYLTNSDFLNKKLNQNKNLVIKNTSCAYVDYSQHNAIGLYKLVRFQSDETRKNVAMGYIKSLYSTLDNYKSCNNYSAYKEELKNILDSSQQQEDIYTEDRMNTFLHGLPYDDSTEQQYETQPLVEDQTPVYPQPNYSDTMQTGGTY